MNTERGFVATVRSKARARLTGQPPPSAVAGVVPTPPPPAPPADPVLGVCLSGGGSRALTAALGALSGLRSLPAPDDPAASAMDRVSHLSSVSGGSWASVAYTFLPDEVGGEPIDDDTFLIEPVAPDRLVKGGDTPSSENVEHMDPRCLGTAPQQFAPLPIAKVLWKYWRWGLFKNPEKWNWFWIAAIGELILRPFDLYDARYPRSKDVTEPKYFFSSTPDYVRSQITPDNPGITDDEFHYVRPGRPSLVVNFNLLADERADDPIQAPVQATPEVTGMLGESPGGSIVGGGSVQSFGFATELAGRGGEPDTAQVDLERRYSLSDIAGCSSAFFAEDLLNFVNNEIGKVEAATVTELKRVHVPSFIARLLAQFLASRCKPLADANLSDLIPRYPYWTLGELDADEPTTTEFGFSDGGSFEDTGVLGMLARTDANRIIAFVNGAEPLAKNSDQVKVDGQLATLFGRTWDKDNGRYEPYEATDPRRFAQVFDTDNGEFEAMLDGLWNASTANDAEPAGTYTVACAQQLTTIENEVARIARGREVTVLWVVNNRVNAWQDQIGDAAIQDDLRRGQAGQNADGTPSDDGGEGSGPLDNFPLYTTGPQIHLDEEAVNMLAQLSAWNVEQLDDEIAGLLAP